MGLLSNDQFSRGRFTPRPSVAFTLRLPALFFVSFALLVLSRLDHPVVRELRAEAEALIAPALGGAMVPFDPARRLVRQVRSSYDGFSELERLKGENQRLKQMAELRARGSSSARLPSWRITHVLEQQSMQYRTVRVIATSSGAFVHSALRRD